MIYQQDGAPIILLEKLEIIETEFSANNDQCFLAKKISGRTGLGKTD